MLIVSTDEVENLIRKLDDASKLNECRDEVKRMLRIKSELLWWAESGKCCLWQPAAQFTSEIQTLKNVLDAIEEGAISRASSLLKDYVNQLKSIDSNYDSSQPS